MALSSTLKGIKIEFGGDTTKLGTALKEINKDSANTQKSLSQLNKLLVFDPRGTTALTEKQKELTDAVESTSKKLDVLQKTRESMLADKENWTDRDKAAFEELGKEIAITELELKKAEKALQDFGSVGAQKLMVLGEGLKSTGNHIKDMGQSTLSLGKKLTVGITTPIVGMGTALGKTALEFLSLRENATIAFETMLGSTKAAKDMLNSLYVFARTTPFRYEGILEASKNLIQMGMDADDVIPTLKAVGDAAAASGKGQEAFNDITEALGRMQAAGKVSLKDIWSLSRDGVQALQILANGAGVSASEMKAKISSGSVDATRAIATLTKGIEEGTSGLAGYTTAVGGMMEKIKSSSFTGAIDSLKSAFRNLALAAVGESEKVSGSQSNLLAALTPVINQLKQLMDTLAQKMREAGISAVPAIEGIGGAIRDLTRWVNGLDPKMVKLFAEALKLLVGLGPALMVFGTVQKLIGSFIITIGSATKSVGAYKEGLAKLPVPTNAATAAMQKMNLAMNSNAIGLVITGISLLVSAFSLLLPVMYEASKGMEVLSASSQKQKDEVDRLTGAYEEAKARYGDLSDEAGRAKAALDDATDSFMASRRTVDDLKDSIQGNIKAQKDWSKSTADAVKDVSATYGALDNMVDEYDALASKTNLSESESQRMAQIVRQLGRSDIPELAEAANSMTGRMDASSESMRAWIATARDRAKFAVIEEALTEAYRKQAKAQMELEDAQESLTEAQRAYDEIQGPMNSRFNANTKEIRLAKEAVHDLTKIVDAATLAQAEYDAEIQVYERRLDGLTGPIEETASKTENLTQAQADLADSLEEVMVRNDSLKIAMDSAGLSTDELAIRLDNTNISVDDLKKAVEDYVRSAQDGFHELTAQSEVDLETWKSTLAANAEHMRTWGQDTEDVFSRTGVNFSEGFINEIMGGGFERYGNMVYDMKNMSDKQLQDLVDIYDGAGQAGTDAYLQGISPLAPKVKEEMVKTGEAINDGLTTGLRRTWDEVIGAANSSSEQLIDKGFKSPLGVRSPSSVTREIGMNLDRGFAEGISAGKDAMAAAQKAADGVVGKLKDSAKDSTKAGGELAKSFGTGISGARGTAQSAGAEVASAASFGMRSQNSNAWTWGSDLVANMASGIKGSISSALAAATSVASSIKSVLGFSRPETGPLRDFESYMPDMVAGLARTLRQAAPKLIGQAKDMALEVSDAINSYEVKAPRVPDLGSITGRLAAQQAYRNNQEYQKMIVSVLDASSLDAIRQGLDRIGSPSGASGANIYIGDITYTPDSRIAKLLSEAIEILVREKNMGKVMV